MNNYQQYLHREALALATQYRKMEGELLTILQRVDRQRVYRQLGYASLYAYCTQALNLSEGQTYNLIQVGRKSVAIPALQTAIAEGSLTVSKAVRIVSVLTPQNQEALITMAKTLPKPQLEREVAKLNPKTATPERARFVTVDRLELKLGLSETIMTKLKRIQDIIATAKRQAVSLEETLDNMCEVYLDKHDPLRKAERAISRNSAPGRVKTRKSETEQHLEKSDKALSEAATGQASFPAHQKLGIMPAAQSPQAENMQIGTALSRHIPAPVRHAVVVRDHGRCSHVDEHGKPCGEQRWLEFHHREPLAYGGEHRADNLTLLCAGHHRVLHEDR